MQAETQNQPITTPENAPRAKSNRIKASDCLPHAADKLGQHVLTLHVGTHSPRVKSGILRACKNRALQWQQPEWCADSQ
jgi:hypothetical protein